MAHPKAPLVSTTLIDFDPDSRILQMTPLDPTCPQVGLDTIWRTRVDSEPRWGWSHNKRLGMACCTRGSPNTGEKDALFNRWRPLYSTPAGFWDPTREIDVNLSPSSQVLDHTSIYTYLYTSLHFHIAFEAWVRHDISNKGSCDSQVWEN